MRFAQIFLHEATHFLRNPYKPLALLLLVVVGLLGLHNGASLYKAQTEEIQSIREKASSKRSEHFDLLKAGKTGPEDRPWVNLQQPFWALYSLQLYAFKNPSPAMVYSLGQAEQNPYYKLVTMSSSPYDDDMAQEIANPERLKVSRLDFAFVVLIIMPLVLLVLTYNLKSAEVEKGMIKLLEVQSGQVSKWLMSRFLFYFILLAAVMIGMIAYGIFLPEEAVMSGEAVLKMMLLTLLYLALWSMLYLLILSRAGSTLYSSISMLSLVLLITIVIPAAVSQFVSYLKPAGLLSEYLVEKRERSEEFYSMSDSTMLHSLLAAYPEIQSSPLIVAEEKSQLLRRSSSAILNQDMLDDRAQIEAENEARNALISKFNIVNPFTFFYNQFNRLAETHYDDYKAYRLSIQNLVDHQNKVLVVDTWQQVAVDTSIYKGYIQQFAQP